MESISQWSRCDKITEYLSSEREIEKLSLLRVTVRFIGIPLKCHELRVGTDC